MRPLALAAAGIVALASSSALAKGKLWLVIDQGTESKLGASTMVEDFWACTLNATDFNDYVSKYKGPSLRPANPLDFGAAVIVDTSACGTPDSPGWEPMLQCVINASKITPVDGDYIHYIPPVGGFDARNCTLCNVTSNNKLVSIRAGITRSGKASDFTFAGIHEAFEGITYGGADDCCNGYFANGVPEAQSCVSLFGSTGGELTVQCGYRGYQEQRLTYGVRGDGVFHGEDCTAVKVVALPGSRESVCTLPKAQRLSGKCINGDVVTCEYIPTATSCPNGCFEDAAGAHCTQVGAECSAIGFAQPTLCPGQSSPMHVSCKNTGNAPWTQPLTLVTSPDADSAIVDPTWISAREAALMQGEPVAPGQSGEFAFFVRAPSVSPQDEKQDFVLRAADGGAPLSSAPLKVVVHVTACADDAGPDGSNSTDPPIDVPGCSCSESSTAPHDGKAVVALALALGLSLARRRPKSA